MKYFLIALVVGLSIMCGFLYGQNKALSAATDYSSMSAGKVVSVSFKNAR